MKSLGEIEIEEITELEQYQRVFPELTSVAACSWKAPLGKAFSNSRHQVFFKLLGQEAARRGWLSVWTLRLEGRMIAFEFHLRDSANVNHAMKAEFDENYRALSPGSVLDYHVIKALFEQGRKGYDLGGSAHFYKLRWTRDYLRHVDVVAFNPRLRGKALYAFEYGLITQLRIARGLMRRCLGIIKRDHPRSLAVKVT